jgi:hypothetical protein
MDRKTKVATACWNSVLYVGHQKVSFEKTTEIFISNVGIMEVLLGYFWLFLHLISYEYIQFKNVLQILVAIF